MASRPLALSRRTAHRVATTGIAAFRFAAGGLLLAFVCALASVVISDLVARAAAEVRGGDVAPVSAAR
jgi:hypothetical protein